MDSDDNKSVEVNEIIQIAPPHKWGGCLAVVSEMKSFGVQCYVSIPHNDGTPPSDAYIRITWEEFERVVARGQFSLVPTTRNRDRPCADFHIACSFTEVVGKDARITWHRAA